MDLNERKRAWALYCHRYWCSLVLICLCCFFISLEHRKSKKIRPKITYSLLSKVSKQYKHLKRLTSCDEAYTKHMLRFTIPAFKKFCALLVNMGGLRASKYLCIEEQVAIFLYVLSHHNKNRTCAFYFNRSGHTISKYFNRVLSCLLKLHNSLLAQPIPITWGEEDRRWGSFPGCVGALDGTYCHVMVREEDKPRYRSRKGTMATNVLAACEFNGMFTYALAGWEGSAADGRVLRDAIHRTHGLKVPKGTYYLCDNGYTNCEGFLTPYRGVRYHLKEWGEDGERPVNHEEYFNMKHSQARNVTERTFGVLKKRWSVFRSNTFYPLKTQKRIILACMLIHNFQLKTMPHDMDDGDDSSDEEDNGFNGEDQAEHDFVDVIENTNEWTAFRDNMAVGMYNAWLARHGHEAD